MFKTLLASGSYPTWDLHNVPSAHSFPFVKQDRSTCHRYMRTVHWQNGEQVSRTVFTLWSTRQLACSSICTSNPRLFPSCTSNHEDLEAVQRRSVTEGCSACRRMEESSRAGLDRSAHIARGSACVRSRACALTRRTTTAGYYKNSARTTRLARFRSPIIVVAERERAHNNYLHEPS